MGLSRRGLVAHRRIGQGRVSISGERAQGGSALDAVAKLIDWPENAR
jgi:hypothetical protein